MPNPPEIPASVRYTGARNELNQRISVRVLLQTSHVAAIVLISAAFIAIRQQNSDLEILLIPGLLLPVLSLAFVIWHQHNEFVIGMLSGHLRLLERIDASEYPQMPSWFYVASPRHDVQSPTLASRHISDYALLGIIAVPPFLYILDLCFSFRIGISFYRWIPTITYILPVRVLSFTFVVNVSWHSIYAYLALVPFLIFFTILFIVVRINTNRQAVLSHPMFNP